MLFMATDMLGGVFSVVSLVFQSQFDGVAALSYILVVVRLSRTRCLTSSNVFFQVLDGIVVIAALILNPIAKRRRRREAEAVAAASVSRDLEVGGPFHEGQLALAEAVAAVQSRHNSGSNLAPVMKQVNEDH